MTDRTWTEDEFGTRHWTNGDWSITLWESGQFDVSHRDTEIEVSADKDGLWVKGETRPFGFTPPEAKAVDIPWAVIREIIRLEELLGNPCN